MAKEEKNLPGVYIKPLVRQELDGYVDGYGNKRDWRSYNKGLNVQKFQIQPNPFQRSITFRGLITSEEPRDPNNSTGAVRNIKRGEGFRKVRKRPAPKRFIQYLVTVRFHGLDFRDKESVQFNQKWEVAGRTSYTRVPTIAANPAMLKCQCRDFMFTWEKPLADEGGLWPNNVWTKYQRLTPKGTGYPERNPKEKMGYCKHIATMLQYLNDSGLLRNK
jgi:hypothetical protein